MRYKKGLSGIIVTMILIAISLVVVGVVWFVISGVISNTEGEIGTALDNALTPQGSLWQGSNVSGGEVVSYNTTAYPGTAAGGWANPDYAKTDDGSYAQKDLAYEFGYVYDNDVRLIKSDSSLGTENKAETGVNWAAAWNISSYGNSSDLWGETWTAEDINDADFGIAFTAVSDSTSPYLNATNFSFSIPTGATIDGIFVEIEKRRAASGGVDLAFVDFFRITIYYSASS